MFIDPIQQIFNAPKQPDQGGVNLAWYQKKKVWRNNEIKEEFALIIKKICLNKIYLRK